MANPFKSLKTTALCIGFLLVFIIQSCDPVFNTRLSNKSSADIILEIQFDKENIESTWGGRPYIPYLEGILNGGGTTIQFDTIKLISKTKIRPTESFEIEEGVGTQPDFFAIKKMTIYAIDTLVLDNKEKMKAAFTEVNTRNFELEIK